MKYSVVLLLSLAACLTHALVEFHAINAPSHWVKVVAPPHPNTRMKLFVGLKQRNLNVLEAKVLQAADIDDEHYGEWLNLQQVTDLVAPEQRDINTIIKWLHDNGITATTLTKSRDFIRVTATVQAVEQLLKTQLSYFQHTQHENMKIVRSDTSYFLPDHIDEIIDFIGPIHGFTRAKKRVVNEFRYSDVEVVPTLVRQYYNITIDTKPSRFINNTQAVEEFSYQFFLPSDIQQFFQQFSPSQNGQQVVKVIGLDNSSFTSTEADLDVEYIMATGAFAPTYVYSYNYPTQDIMILFLEWVVDLSDDPQPPLVHSVSYGEYGGDYPIRQVLRISNEWMKLTGRGLSIMFASGDDGVGCNDNGTYFAFPYPSSPWITLVGSTGLYEYNDESGATKYYEKGASFSSGGFSEDFKMPVWQESAVKYYLQNAPNISWSFFNPKGRALPDVSTVGENVQIIMDGEQTAVAGTSCSSPIFAGMISLLNGVRLSAGKKSLGFLNPLIYKTAAKYPTAFFDVTQGYNDQDPCPGFYAFKGWDPVTGVGTPNFEKLLQIVKTLK